MSQDVHNQQYQPTHGAQHAHENQYRPSNYQPASCPVPTIRQYSKELTQLDKLYKNEDKFGGTGDNFTFKLSIFHDKCQLVGLPPDAYLEGASIMLTGQAQTHFYANRESIVSFKDFCRKIRLFFEGPEWERLNLIKWQTVSLADTIAANPTLSTAPTPQAPPTQASPTQQAPLTKALLTEAPPTQAAPILAAPVQVPLKQATRAQVPLVQAPPAQASQTQAPPVQGPPI